MNLVVVVRISIWTAHWSIGGDDPILRSIPEFERDDHAYRQPFRPLSHIASVAMAETRLAGQVVPNALRHLAPIVAWSVASIALGLVVGLAAVILPPLGAFGIVAVCGVALLWVMPDLPLVSPGAIRKAFFCMLIAALSIPFYYMLQFPGLPWISARRVATFGLAVPFLIAIAASSSVRRHIAERIRASRFIIICAAGYLVMAALSIPTSMLPTESFSGTNRRCPIVVRAVLRHDLYS